MAFRPPDPKSGASASSATLASNQRATTAGRHSDLSFLLRRKPDRAGWPSLARSFLEGQTLLEGAYLDIDNITVRP